MKHRFLHTLVFSSVLALEGCTSTPPHSPDAQAGTAGAGAEVERTEEAQSAPSEGYAEVASPSAGSSSLGRTNGSGGSGGGSYGSGRRAPEPAAAEVGTLANVAEMRRCEIGWGTTKSGRRQIDPWDCSLVSTGDAERTECTDAGRRCLQP